MFLVRHGQSEFNVHFSVTGRDPLIRDPELTELGRSQVRAAADSLRGFDLKRIIASPYRRALQTAEILSDQLGLDCRIDATVGEHALYHCDIGTVTSELRRGWPRWSFDHLAEEWWPASGEDFGTVQDRSRNFFASQKTRDDFDGLLIVSHWGFIRSLTETEVGNCGVLKINREAPRKPKVIFEIAGLA
ncbi:MAG: histidine phosphatase family protein [Candidatus Pacebacteria bacterium]|nr:histidine phosphatase family protein [Candidatus Paceibacterota bacterium]